MSIGLARTKTVYAQNFQANNTGGTAVNAGTNATPSPSSSVTIDPIKNPLKATTATEAAKRLINLLLSLIAIASVIMIMYSGFRMVAYAGNEQVVKSAKNAIIYSIAGLVVAIMSFSIISIIQRILS